MSPFRSHLVAFFCGAVIAVLVVNLFDEHPAPSVIGQNMTFVPDPKDDAQTAYSVGMTEGTIMLRILSRPDFNRQRNAPNVVAFTRSYARPCTVYIPEGFKINFWPMAQTAYFAEADDAETLAHEILHCYVPRWHDVPGAP